MSFEFDSPAPRSRAVLIPYWDCFSSKLKSSISSLSLGASAVAMDKKDEPLDDPGVPQPAYPASLRSAIGTRRGFISITRNEHFIVNIVLLSKYTIYHCFFGAVRKMSECFGQ